MIINILDSNCRKVDKKKLAELLNCREDRIYVEDEDLICFGNPFLYTDELYNEAYVIQNRLNTYYDINLSDEEIQEIIKNIPESKKIEICSKATKNAIDENAIEEIEDNILDELDTLLCEYIGEHYGKHE